MSKAEDQDSASLAENKAKEEKPPKKSIKSQFIALKKQQMRIAKQQQPFLEQLDRCLENDNFEGFQALIMKQDPKIILEFLFRQMDLIVPPISAILKSKKVIEFIQVVNRWAASSTSFFNRFLYELRKDAFTHDPNRQPSFKIQQNKTDRLQISGRTNQLIEQKYQGILVKGWRNKFINFNKSLIQKLKNQHTNLILFQITTEIGRQNGLFFSLQPLLNFSLVRQLISRVDESFYLNQLYIPLSKNIPKLYQDLTAYDRYLRKQTIWKKIVFNDLSIFDDIELIRLYELDYNVLHELARKKDTQGFLKLFEMIKGAAGSEMKSVKELLVKANIAGETTTDIILRTWPMKDINYVFNAAVKQKILLLSRQCLNKILTNRLLNQQQIDQLIQRCFDGPQSRNGYVYILQKQKQLTKQSWKKLKKAKRSQNYVFRFDNQAIKQALNSSGYYPLHMYLVRFMQRSSLKIVEKLFLPCLQRKIVKKQTLLFLKSLKDGQLRVQAGSPGSTILYNLNNYYYPLLEILTKIKHCELWNYLYPKIYFNAIKILTRQRISQQLSKRFRQSIAYIGENFINYYLNQAPFLGEDDLNKQILNSIINCKQSEIHLNEINVFYELLTSLSRNETILNSKQFLPTQIKKYIKLYFKSFSTHRIMTEGIYNRSTKDKFPIIYYLYPVKRGLILNQYFQKEEIMQKMNESEQQLKQIIQNTQKPAIFFCDKQIQAAKYFLQLCSKLTYSTTKNQILQTGTFNQILVYYRRNRTIQNLRHLVNELLKNTFLKDKQGYMLPISVDQKDLESKIAYLLSHNIDFYFQKLALSKPITATIGDLNYRKALQRMQKYSCTFLDSLIYCPDSQAPNLDFFSSFNKEILCRLIDIDFNIGKWKSYPQRPRYMKSLSVYYTVLECLQNLPGSDRQKPLYVEQQRQHPIYKGFIIFEVNIRYLTSKIQDMVWKLERENISQTIRCLRQIIIKDQIIQLNNYLKKWHKYFIRLFGGVSKIQALYYSIKAFDLKKIQPQPIEQQNEQQIKQPQIAFIKIISLNQINQSFISDSQSAVRVDYSKILQIHPNHNDPPTSQQISKFYYISGYYYGIFSTILQLIQITAKHIPNCFTNFLRTLQPIQFIIRAQNPKLLNTRLLIQQQHYTAFLCDFLSCLHKNESSYSQYFINVKKYLRQQWKNGMLRLQPMLDRQSKLKDAKKICKFIVEFLLQQDMALNQKNYIQLTKSYLLMLLRDAADQQKRLYAFELFYRYIPFRKYDQKYFVSCIRKNEIEYACLIMILIRAQKNIINEFILIQERGEVLFNDYNFYALCDQRTYEILLGKIKAELTGRSKKIDQKIEQDERQNEEAQNMEIVDGENKPIKKKIPQANNYFEKKIVTIVRSLILGECWTKVHKLLQVYISLFSVQPQNSQNSLQDQFTHLVINIFNFLSSFSQSLTTFLSDDKYKQMTKLLFDAQTSINIPFSQQRFMQGFFIDYSSACQQMKPTKLTLANIYTCLKKYPESVIEFLIAQTIPDEQSVPPQKVLNNMCPVVPYSQWDFNKFPWLCQLVRYELQLLSKLNIQSYLSSTLTSIILQPKLSPHLTQLYGEKGLQKLANAIMNSKSVTTLTPYLNYVPELIAKFQEICQAKFMPLYGLQSSLTIQLITNDVIPATYLSKIFQTCNMTIFDHFIHKHNIILSKQHFNWQHLLTLKNQQFIINLIIRYHLFEKFQLQQYSNILLTTICREHFNELLKYVLNHFTTRFQKPIICIAETDKAACITSTGLFKLPIPLAITWNYYEYYYLILQCKNQCQPFTLSQRLLVFPDADLYSFIPQFKKRIEIYNIACKQFKEAQHVDYRYVIIKTVFAVQSQEERELSKKQIQFSRFLENIAQGTCPIITMQSNNFQIVHALILDQSNHKIPLKQLKKLYPKQTNYIPAFQQFFTTKQAPTTSNILNYQPRLRSYLLIYNFLLFMQLYPNQLDKLSPIDQYQQQQKPQTKQMAQEQYCPRQQEITVYLQGVQCHLLQLSTTYESLLVEFVKKSFRLNIDPITKRISRLNLKRHALQLLLLQNTGQCVKQLISTTLKSLLDCQIKNQWELMFQLSEQINMRTGIPAFDMSFWIKIIEAVEDIQQIMKDHKQPLLDYPKNYQSFVKATIDNSSLYFTMEQQISSYTISVANFIQTLTQTLLFGQPIKSILVLISILLNYNQLQSSFHQIIQIINQTVSDRLFTTVIITLVPQNGITNLVSLKFPQLRLQIPFKILSTIPSYKYLSLTLSSLKTNLDQYILLSQFRTNPTLPQFLPPQLQFAIGLQFQYNTNSFKQITQHKQLILLLRGGITDKIMQLVNDLQYKRSVGLTLYNVSDVYGPMKINQQTDQRILLNCLAYYRYPILHNQKVFIRFIENPKRFQHDSKYILSDLKEYFRYFIKETEIDNESRLSKFKFNNIISVSLQHTTNPQLDTKIILHTTQWSMCNIVNIFALIYNFTQTIISSFYDTSIDLRVSIPGLIAYYQKLVDIGCTNLSIGMIEQLKQFLYSKTHKQLVQSMMSMVLEDVGDIMKMFKGIVLTYQILSQPINTTQNRTILNNHTSATSIHYQIHQQILLITFDLYISPSHNSNQPSTQQFSILSRKQFFQSIFKYTQFFTDHFITRPTLDSQCVQLSRKLSSHFNCTLNLHINYDTLYTYIIQLRQQPQSKHNHNYIEQYLQKLCQYLTVNMDELVIDYLQSKDVIAIHQALVINNFQSIFRKISFEEVEKSNVVQYCSEQMESQTGLEDFQGYGQTIKGCNESVKNAYLIQIYKSSFALFASEGMTFILGYKQSKKPPTLLKITKPQHLSSVDINLLFYVLLVVDILPTNDQLPHNKIIRVFYSDLNHNIYKINQTLVTQMLATRQKDQRKISEIIPIASANMKLQFLQPGVKLSAESSLIKGFQIILRQDGKFKLTPQPIFKPTLLNELKRNSIYKKTIKILKLSIHNTLHTKISIIVQISPISPTLSLKQQYPNLIKFTCEDIQQFFIKFCTDPLRNPNIDSLLAIQYDYVINQSVFVSMRRKIFAKYYSSVRLLLIGEKTDQRVRIVPNALTGKSQIVIQICDKQLVSTVQIMVIILHDLINRQYSDLPKEILLQHERNITIEAQLKILDMGNICQLQLKQIKSAQQLLTLLTIPTITTISTIKIQIQNKLKNSIQLISSHTLNLAFSSASPTRQFFTIEQICQTLLNRQISHNQQIVTYYDYYHKQIVVEKWQPYGQTFLLLRFNKQWKLFKPTVQTNNKRKTIQLTLEQQSASRYVLISTSKQTQVLSEYIYQIPDNQLVKEKSHNVCLNETITILLTHSKDINMNFCPVIVSSKAPLDKQIPPLVSLTRKDYYGVFNAKMLAKKVLRLDVTNSKAAIININFAGYRCLISPLLQNCTIIFSSQNTLCLEQTKFLQVHYRDKIIPVKQNQQQQLKSQFNQPPQLFSLLELPKVNQGNPQNLGKNLQSMVYLVADECQKYLTVAGQLRTDYFQLCDRQGNPIYYTGHLNIYLQHVNQLGLIRPQLVKLDTKIGLKWTPTVRGHYNLFINNTRLDPSYEIGVCADQADYRRCQAQQPKKLAICYKQQTGVMISFKDKYNNIYTKLEQDIIGELLLEVEVSQMQLFVKIEKTTIDKYGSKNLLFSIESEEVKQENMTVVVKLNKEPIIMFTLMISGYSLQKRKKLLTADIEKLNKNYSKYLDINRSRFIEDILRQGQSDLHYVLSIKFIKEEGIDAGGLKRQFYDMIGNQLKSQKNPFLLPINSRNQYFFNPQLRRNAKCNYYMQIFGKYLANSILNTYLIGVSFSPTFVKLLYNYDITYQDMFDILPELQAQNYRYLLKARQEEFQDLELYFSYCVDRKKGIEKQLKENGKSIMVTKDNVKEYFTLLTQTIVIKPYQQIITSFRKGFQSVISLTPFIRWIKSTQFWCVTAGVKDLTADAVIDYIIFTGSKIQQMSVWFKRYLLEADREVLLKFLKFSTGSSSIDFIQNGKIQVKFERIGDNPKLLPISHTCFKRIQVPIYKTYDIMKQKLTITFSLCAEGFQIA